MSRRILVVEDETDLADILADYLKGCFRIGCWWLT